MGGGPRGVRRRGAGPAPLGPPHQRQLHTFRPLLDTDWSEGLRPELAWLSGTLAHGARLRGPAGAAAAGAAPAVRRRPVPAAAGVGAPRAAARGNGPRRAPAADAPAATDRSNLTVGAAKAGALLDRQLTLARTRAHSTALQALGSGRFHAVADRIAVLAGEVPLSPAAASADLRLLAAAAEERLDRRGRRAAPAHRRPPLQRGGPRPRPRPGHLPTPAGRPLAPGPAPAAPAPLRARGPHGGRPRRDPPADRGRPGPDPPPGRREAAAAAAEAARTPRIAPATAYALGVLHADQRHEVEAARFAFHHLWHRLPR